MSALRIITCIRDVICIVECSIIYCKEDILLIFCINTFSPLLNILWFVWICVMFVDKIPSLKYCILSVSSSCRYINSTPVNFLILIGIPVLCKAQSELSIDFPEFIADNTDEADIGFPILKSERSTVVAGR